MTAAKPSGPAVAPEKLDAHPAGTKRGGALGEAPLTHGAAITALVVFVSASVVVGDTYGTMGRIMALIIAGPVSIGAGYIVHGLPRSVPRPKGDGPKTYVNPRGELFMGLGVLLAAGIGIGRFLPLQPVAGLMIAGFIAPAGYLLPYAWGPSVVLLSDVEVALTLRGRLIWRAPLGNNSWIRIDSTGGRNPVSFVAFGTRVREFGRVVDHADLTRPVFVEFVRDLRNVAAKRPELYLVDNLGGLETAPPKTEPAITRTSFNATSSDEGADFELPPDGGLSP